MGGLRWGLRRAPAGPRLILLIDGGQCASLPRERVIKVVERLAKVPLVHIRSMVKETCDAIVDLGNGEGCVLAMKISMFPHDLSVADGV